MFKLSKETIDILEDLERRLDPEVEEDLEGQWREFLFNRAKDEIFVPSRIRNTPAGVPLRVNNINDDIADLSSMLHSQLSGASSALARGGDNVNIRANYGTGILSSVFGAELFIMPYKNNTLPTTRVVGGIDKIRSIVEAGIPSLTNGLGQRVFDFGELCLDVFRKYPKVSRYLEVYHPDLQGPLDICELMWGTDMFYAMYDEPELVHSFLSLITDTYVAFMEKWQKMYPPRLDFNTHWGNLRHRGSILIRNDSAMNLSPELYEEFSVPYDSRLLERFGGGGVHFCGRGDHYIELLAKIPKMYAVQMSQPQYNDMEKIYKHTVDKGIKLLAFNYDRALSDLCRAGGFHGNLHCGRG